MCVIEPTVTRLPAEDDGLLLNAAGMGDQDVIKPANGAHQDQTLKEDVPEQGRDADKEVKAERDDEPCTSSSSQAHLQVALELPATPEANPRATR